MSAEIARCAAALAAALGDRELTFVPVQRALLGSVAEPVRIELVAAGHGLADVTITTLHADA